MPNALRVLGIFLVALILNRILRVLTNLIVKPAASKTRGAQAREQQTRTVATVLYGAGSKVVWALAILTAIPEFGDVFIQIESESLALDAVLFQDRPRRPLDL